MAKRSPPEPTLFDPLPPLSPPQDKFTDEQRSAIATRNLPIVLSAGAGSGKTRVLTERYLAYLRENLASVSRIVAITFTEKAAREMRDRIRTEMEDRHAAATGADAERWATHLRELESAPISTIHSFCTSILRHYALEIGLDSQFEVLDDLLAANLKAAALDERLRALLTEDSAAGAALARLVPIFGWYRVQSGVHTLIDDFQEAEWSAWLEREPQAIADGWHRLAEELLPELRRRHLARGTAVARCLALLRAGHKVPDKLAGPVADLLEWLPQLAIVPDPTALAEKVIEQARLHGTREKSWKDAGAEVYQAFKKTFDDLRKEMSELSRLTFTVDDGAREAAAIGQDFLRVAGEVARDYQERKRREGVVDFRDLLMLTRDLLRAHPSALAALQQRYHYFLLDELQDTDPVQMEIIDRLVADRFDQGKLFAVGDAKQSIYRFRGAEVSLFRNLRERAPQEGRLSLTRNFRSQPGVVQFVNALSKGQLPDYEPLVAARPQTSHGPSVEFLWTVVDGTRDKQVEADAGSVAQRIRQMLAGERLAVNNKAEPPEARPVRAGDIALLFRSMTQVPEYENALRAFGIDYYLVGGRGYFAQQEIYDVLHLLRTLENPRDTLSLVGVLRSPFCCVSDEAIFLLNRAAEGIWEAWHRQPSDLPVPDDQSATVARARHHLLRWREAKDRLRIADLLRLAIAESGYDAALRLEFLGERKLANLWKLIDMAREFDRSGRFGLADFIARLSDIVAEQPREEQAATLPEGADVVRIMSVHQAKGLEFPVVIVPDINRGLGQGSYPSAVWHATLGCVARPPDEAGDRLFSEFGKQLLDRLEGLLDWDEELRTLYVVCTRAADHLILSGAIKPEDLNQEQPITRSPWMDALSRRFHLRSGVCLDPAIAAEFNPEVRVLEQLPLTDRPQRPESAGSGALPAFEPANLEPVAVAQPALVALSAVQQAIAAETDSEVIAWSEHYDAEDGQDLNDWEELILPGELREEIEAASEVRYRFDFVLVFDAALPSVVGRIEALWTDRAGEQHLLLCAGADVRTTVAAAVEAVRRQLGEPPATVAVLAGGGITRLPPAEWNVAEGLDSLQRALTARARPPRLA